MNEPVSELRALIARCSRLFDSGHGIESTEVDLFRIIDIISRDSCARREFIELSELTLMSRDLSGVEDAGIPREVLELASYELRWPELTSLARRRIDKFFHGSSSLAVGDVSVAMIKAASGDWEDREFYVRYQST